MLRWPELYYIDAPHLQAALEALERLKPIANRRIRKAFDQGRFILCQVNARNFRQERCYFVIYHYSTSV
jgi:hypothetical protein